MLVSVEEFEAYTGTSGDTLNEAYIRAAEEIVTNYLGYSPAEQNYDELYDGSGANGLFLKAGNITEVSEVLFDGVPVYLDKFYIKENCLMIKGGQFPFGVQNIRVKYTAGWSAEEVPDVIKGTILQIAGVRQIESGQNIGVSSKSFGDSGSRAFLNTRKYNDFLFNISGYKLI